TGAVKVGFAVLEPLRVTAGPPVCSQAYCSASPFGSQLSEPSRVTVAEEETCCSAPATAAGVGSEPGTLPFTVSALLLPGLSLTVREKASPVACEGVVKLGVAVLARVRVTFEPPVWVQA